MKKSAAILGASVLTMGLLTACGGGTDVDTGGSNDTAKKEEVKKDTQGQAKDDGSKKFNAGIAQDILGLKINIAEIKIESNKVTIGMNVENPTKDTISFYPDQGNIVIGDMQLDPNVFGGTGDISGDISPGVKKDGAILFDVPEGKTLDVAKVTQLVLNFGDVFNQVSYDTKPATITVPVK